MGPLYLGKMGTFVNFRYINNLAVSISIYLFLFSFLEYDILHILFHGKMLYFVFVTGNNFFCYFVPSVLLLYDSII